MEVAPRITNFFESYFGVKYVLPKQDNVAVPDFTFGAMENWGLITYRWAELTSLVADFFLQKKNEWKQNIFLSTRESALLHNPAVDTVRSKQSVCDIIAHELAHQWVGNLGKSVDRLETPPFSLSVRGLLRQLRASGGA